MCDLPQRHVRHGAGACPTSALLRRPLELEQSILEPSASLSPNFRFVRLVTKTGTVVTGRLLNQSTFSVQILVDGTGFARSTGRTCASSRS